MKFLILGIFTTLFFALGCQTSGVVLRETPLGISETRTTISGLIGQPRAVSENGREMLSTYYDKKDQPIAKDSPPRERFYTHITILGDRRPYDIVVEVVVQVRDSDGIYQDVDKDEIRAEKLGEKISKALAQSRDKRNLFDDFKPY